jgi:hypothetical protein
MIDRFKQRSPYGDCSNLLNSFKYRLNYQKAWYNSRGFFTPCSKTGCENPSIFLLAIIEGFQKYKCPCVCKYHLHEGVVFFHPKKVFVYRLNQIEWQHD